MTGWAAYTKWRRDSAEIADATTFGMTRLVERAPDGPELLQYLSMTAPAVVTGYTVAAQDAAVGYLRAAQREAGITPVQYNPAMATVTWAALEPITKWALSDVTVPYTVEDVLPRLTQGSTRLVSNVGRGTVITGAEATGQTVTWRRVPRADACAYCRLMSQWSYERQQDASRTVARFGYTWRDRHGRSRWRAFDGPAAAKGSKQGAGSEFHGHCRCEPVAIFGDWSDGGVPDSIEDRWDEFANQWDTAYTWALDEQTRQRENLRAEIWARPISNEEKLAAWKQERKALPNLEQIALGRMRKEHGIR